MSDDFHPSILEESRRFDRFFIPMSSFIEFIYTIYSRLIADLYPSHAIATQSYDLLGRDPVWTSLYSDTDDSTFCSFISLLGFFERSGCVHLIGSIDLKSSKVLLYIFLLFDILLFYAPYFSFISLYQALLDFLDPRPEISVGRMGIVDPTDKCFLILLRIHTPCPTDDADITLRDRIASDLE